MLIPNGPYALVGNPDLPDGLRTVHIDDLTPEEAKQVGLPPRRAGPTHPPDSADRPWKPVEPSVGWGVLHLFYRVDRARAEAEPQAGEAHRRRGAVAGRRRPPGAAVRGARPQGRPRRDGARARPRPAPAVPARARGHAARARRLLRVAHRALGVHEHRRRRARPARIRGGPRGSGRRSAARRVARAHGALPRAAHPPAAAAEEDDLLLPDVEAPRRPRPTGTRCRSRSGSDSWPATRASAAPTRAGCCSSSPAPPGSTTGSGASPCSPTTRSR